MYDVYPRIPSNTLLVWSSTWRILVKNRSNGYGQIVYGCANKTVAKEVDRKNQFTQVFVYTLHRTWLEASTSSNINNRYSNKSDRVDVRERKLCCSSAKYLFKSSSSVGVIGNSKNHSKTKSTDTGR